MYFHGVIWLFIFSALVFSSLEGAFPDVFSQPAPTGGRGSHSTWLLGSLLGSNVARCRRSDLFALSVDVERKHPPDLLLPSNPLEIFILDPFDP